MIIIQSKVYDRSKRLEMRAEAYACRMAEASLLNGAMRLGIARDVSLSSGGVWN